MSTLRLFHYFSSPLSPFRNYRDENLPTPRHYAEYAAEVPGKRMIGYNEDYFTKRISREDFFHEKMVKRYGQGIPKYPIYTTLGTESIRFIALKRHMFAVELKILEPSQFPLMFCIGDSMYGDLDCASRRAFYYDEFLNLTMEQVLDLLPDNVCDRYIEVQIWGNPFGLGLFPSQDSPDYLAFLSKSMLSAAFSQDEILPDLTIDDLKRRIMENQLKEPFAEMVHSANLSYIPPGRIHGIPHSFRCAFLALAMAIEEGFSTETALWTAKCAAYHDSGRLFGNDVSHGSLSHIAAEALFSPEKAEASYRVMRCHCENSEYIRDQFNDSESELGKMAEIVHDADSLDYIRFVTERGLDLFDRTYLVRKTSEKYIPAALELVLYSLSGDNWIEQILQ